MAAVRFFAAALFARRNYSSKNTGYASVGAQNAILDKTKQKKSSSKSSGLRVKWTDEQTRIISTVSFGQSVFITGSAGTGKTALLKHIIKLLQKSLGRSNVYVTASTGVAACGLKGQTLHSFAGIRQPTMDRELLLERVLADRKVSRRWNKVRALIIDEISMIDGKLFENLEFIARQVRGSDIPWGGIQLIVGGDFFQLPPVMGNQWFSSNKEFAFEADCWHLSFDLQVELTKVFRQSDERLIKLLQGVRRGEVDHEDMEFLEKSCSEVKPGPSVVRLYPRKDDVYYVNEERLFALGGRGHYFVAEDSGDERRKRQLMSGISENVLLLCEGARVLLIKNVDTKRGLVNGATGTVVGFVQPEDVDVSNICSDRMLPVVKFDLGRTTVVEPETWYLMDGDDVAAKRRQIPLVLAWALSIHKCQGMTLDSLHTDLSKAFGYGMVYVALSRVRSLSGLHLSGFDPSKIKAHPKVLEFYQRITDQDDEKSENQNDSSDSREHRTAVLVDTSS